MSNRFQNKKRAQIGETMTWIIATIVIIVLLAISIFISTAYVGNDKKPSSSYVQITDIPASESFYSYLLTKDNTGKTVYGQLQEENNLNEFNGNLGTSIFKNFYGNEYNNVWVGIIFSRTLDPAKKNDYFGSKPSSYKGGDILGGITEYVSDQITLNENKTVNLYLGDKKK